MLRRPDDPPASPTVAVTLDAVEEINRLRIVARVLANAAHDVNNALQIISGSAELLDGRTDLAPPVQRRIEAIGVQATRAAGTMRELSAYARGDERGRRPLDVAEVVATALALRDFTIKRARIAVRVDRSDARPYQAVADRRDLLQILLNLLLNAERALAGREHAELVIALDRRGGELEVAVADNGPGIPDASRARLRDRDWAALVDPNATGVGLWIAARLAERHGGRLEIADGPESGTRVVVTLPAAS